MFILTEKNSVAKDIATALGGFKNQDGYFSNAKGDCIVAAQGHLLSLKMPEDYDEKYKKWNLEQLPIMPQKMEYKPIAKNSSVLKKIKACFNKFDSTDFVLATDADREGELIGYLILKHIGFKHYDTARRFWVSEALTPEVVKKGLKEARPLKEYNKLAESGKSRQHADWLIGLNVSRLLTCSTNHLLTFGRVQTAVLGAVYLRDKNITQFKSELYYRYRAVAEKDNVRFNFFLKNDEGKDTFYSRDNTKLKQAELHITPRTQVKISKVTETKHSEMPPLLYNITGLQKVCSTEYG